MSCSVLESAYGQLSRAGYTRHMEMPSALVAVTWYFRRDICLIAVAWIQSLLGGPVTADSKMVWYLLFASVPAGLVGVFAGDFIENYGRSLPVIATTTLVFGLLLGLADRHAQKTPGDRTLSFGLAMFIGVAQAMAPVPGVSRSGITITAALLMNMSRQAAARFSFLLSCDSRIRGGQ